MEPEIFNPHQLVADFLRALSQEESWHHHRPSYPEKVWHRCLAKGFDADKERELAARRQALDAMPKHSVRYYEHLYASAEPHMNGHPLTIQAADAMSDDNRHQSRYHQTKRAIAIAGGL